MIRSVDPTGGTGIQCPSSLATYLWMTADFQKMPAGAHEFEITLSCAAKPIRVIPVHIRIYAVTFKPRCSPAAVNWAYYDDLPIWKHPEACLADLIDHGINVFVIHPSNIPSPKKDGTWDVRTADRLVKILNGLHGKGSVLLFLGWKAGRPDWLLFNADENQQRRQENILRDWVRNLRSLMQNAGFDLGDWALYPVDEPHGEKLQCLIKFASLLKKLDSEVRIYANPISAASSPLTVKDLSPLANLVDLWQPGLKRLDKAVIEFFSARQQPWWVFSSPASPAKAAPPWEYYRLLAWRSWALGANGIGFWSYSDTRGTTAWDDFDDRPDWAVVYESEGKPVSSRRWEAFREGVEDFQLLESFASSDFTPDSPYKRKILGHVHDLLNRTVISYSSVSRMRQEMLDVDPKKVGF
ncbi:MAG: hypothetical protein AB9866_25245 [Syntrophobacteraceae bacterium]